MTPTERKVLLLRKNLTVAGLAREFNCLRQELSMCINAAPGREYPHLRSLLAKKLDTNSRAAFPVRTAKAESCLDLSICKCQFNQQQKESQR